MLQAMGWQEGRGLGRRQQGITAPIEVRADRPTRAGAAAPPREDAAVSLLRPSAAAISLRLCEPSEAPLTPVCALSLSLSLHLSPSLSLTRSQASLRTKGAGLGTKGSSYELSATDTYKDIVRKALFARFTELE